MVAPRDVQKDTVDEEEECFDVEVLAPTEAQIKEELRQAFKLDLRGDDFLFLLIFFLFLLAFKFLFV